MKFGQQSDAAFADIQVGLGVPNFPYKALKKQLKASARQKQAQRPIQLSAHTPFQTPFRLLTYRSAYKHRSAY